MMRSILWLVSPAYFMRVEADSLRFSDYSISIRYWAYVIRLVLVLFSFIKRCFRSFIILYIFMIIYRLNIHKYLNYVLIIL